MIIVTGGAGFIGSALVWKLNEMGRDDIIISDKLRKENKWHNVVKRKFYDFIDRDHLLEWLEENYTKVDVIYHMGACSSTMEKDVDFLMDNNYRYTMNLWEFCCDHNIRFLYASSAATYGVGDLGYSDSDENTKKLKPINPYGYSKQIFDTWALKQKITPKQWAGFKFFNVYGPNEYHKHSMASVIFHSYNQALETKKVKLFKSYKDGFEHGMQLRDFVYVKDIVDVLYFFLENPNVSGIFNLGTGNADSFYNLAKHTMEAMGIDPNIEFIEMPEYLRDKYQYYTQAEMNKLKEAGYTKEFKSLKDGAFDYVQNYLMKEDRYL